MRIVIGLIAVLSVGALSQAFANEPEPQSSTTASQPASIASQTQTEAPPADSKAGAKPSAAGVQTTAQVATNAKPAASGKPEMNQEEHNLLRQGYKLEVRDGENWFCKRQPVLGSRLQQSKECGTAAMWAKQHADEQDSLRSSLKSNALPTNMGSTK